MIMDALILLKERSSTLPRFMGEPGPSDQDLVDMFEAATRVPDHGMVCPWRFVVLRGDDRGKMGEVFANALKARNPDAAEESLQAERNRALRAPVVVAVLARTKPHPKVPHVEQIVSAGQAALALHLAGQAKGFGSVMLTGDNAYDPTVKAFFGLKEDDGIIAFLYMGTPAAATPPKSRPEAGKYIEAFGAHAG
jgi:nitroreductase